MGKYSIKDIENLTGIKAHTLRIWESRYNLVTAKRTDTNIRYYDDEQLKLLLNVSLLNRQGVKISKIANLSKDQISKKVLELSETNITYDYTLGLLTQSMIELDEPAFKDHLNNVVNSMGIAQSATEIIYPFLRTVGTLWATGAINPAQEHFASNIIKRKIIAEIQNLNIKPTEQAKRFILFLPEGEMHELGLLIGEYLIKAKGGKTLYLGASVPLSDLIKAHQLFKPDYYLTSFMVQYPNNPPFNEDLAFLSETFSESQILFFGPLRVVQNLNIPKNASYLNSLNDLESYA